MFHWDNKYSVNVKEMDEQHKKWIDIMDNLFVSIINNYGTNSVYKTLKELHEYTIYHFNIEENYMQKFNYKEYENQKKLHDDFRKILFRYISEYNNNNTSFTFSVELMNSLKKWLIEHIQIEDSKYSKSFNENGLL